jgi:hypothetical protein
VSIVSPGLCFTLCDQRRGVVNQDLCWPLQLTTNGAWVVWNDRVYKMICEEKVLLESGENTRRYRGEVVARIAGSGSKSQLDLLEEIDGSNEDEPILRGGGHTDHGPSSRSVPTPVGYERHVTPGSKPEQRLHTATPDLHGLEPASFTRRRMESAAAPAAADGRPQAARTLALGDSEAAEGAEAVHVLREADQRSSDRPG